MATVRGAARISVWMLSAGPCNRNESTGWWRPIVAVDGAAVKRVVELGYTRGVAIEVVSGVSAGERVIVAGHTTLEDGETVDVLTR